MLRSTGDITRNPTAANFGFSPSSPGQSTFPQANPFSLSPFTNLQQDHKVAGRIWKHLLENKHLGDNNIFICTLNSIYQSRSQALDGCFAETRTAAAPQARHGTYLGCGRAWGKHRSEEEPSSTCKAEELWHKIGKTLLPGPGNWKTAMQNCADPCPANSHWLFLGKNWAENEQGVLYGHPCLDANPLPARVTTGAKMLLLKHLQSSWRFPPAPKPC